MAARRKEPVLGREIPSETTMGRAVPTRPRRGRNTPSQKERVIAAIERDHVELWGDGETTAAVINRSGIPTRQVLQGSFLDDSVKPLVDAMVTWTTSVGGGGGSGRDRKGSLFERDLFVVNDSFFEQLAAAYNAADDDIVGAYLSSSEALAFGNIKIECDEDDEANIWDQICDDIDLSSRMREIWRELAITGQAYVASWFGKKPYQVQGKSEAGVKRKKTFANLTVPLGLTVLDPFRVVACLPGESLVYTPRGPVPIADVRQGDVVWSVEDGRVVQAQVTRHACNGVRPLWKLRTRNGEVSCTSDHPVMILKRGGSCNSRPHGEPETEWVPAGEVVVGDYLVRVLGLPEAQEGVPYPDPDIAKMVGILIGDGTRSSRYDGKHRMVATDFFWRHVDRSGGPDACWLWLGKAIKGGRGLWHWHGRDHYPHRIAWQLEYGSVPGTPPGWKRPVQLRRRSPTCSQACVNPYHRVPEADAPLEVLIDPSSVRDPDHSYAVFNVATHIKETASWSQLVSDIGAEPSLYSRKETDQEFQLQFSSQAVLPWAKEVMVHCSSQRFVPSWVWTAPREIKRAFLRGYLEADGAEECQVQGAFRVKASSERLVREMKVLCDDLGISTSNLHKEPVPAHTIAGRAVDTSVAWLFYGYPNTCLHRVPRTYDHYMHQQFSSRSLAARRVNASEPTGSEALVYDLTVANTHNFIADGHVVHNCGNFLFNKETLVYIADPTEKDVIDSWLLGDDSSGADPIIQRLIVAKYEPDYRDRKELVNIGGGGFSIDPNRLYVLNPKYVWRHTLTRPGYSRFAPVPMRRCFELLDLKRQLKAADRAALIGVAQFIVLITKGTDHHPASQYEINYLQGQAATMGSSPVLVGDHRLKVEIITPKTEHILDEGRYGVLNLGIQGTLYGMFMTTHAGRDDSLKLARVVARGLESRRDMQKMAIMRNIFYPVYELNDSLTCIPRMVFHPKRIALDFDPSLATYLLDLFDRNGISRESILAEVDYDEREEAMKRKTEKDKWDQYFTPPIDPLFDPAIAPTSVTAKVGTAGAPAPANNTAPKAGAPKPGSPNDPKRAGRAGGGNHGHAGNGGKPRGAGLPARRGVPADQHSGTYTPPGSAGVKGIRSRPKLEKHGQVSDALEEMQEEIDSTDLTDED